MKKKPSFDERLVVYIIHGAVIYDRDFLGESKCLASVSVLSLINTHNEQRRERKVIAKCIYARLAFLLLFGSGAKITFASFKHYLTIDMKDNS
jgi:hypothetical protein